MCPSLRRIRRDEDELRRELLDTTDDAREREKDVSVAATRRTAAVRLGELTDGYDTNVDAAR